MVGRAGNTVSDALFGVFGLMAYVVPFLLFFGYAFFIANRRNSLIGRKMTGLILLVLFLCAFMQLLTLGYDRQSMVRDFYTVASEDHVGGGFIGGILVFGFGYAFGMTGAYILTVCGLIIAAIVLTQKPLLTAFGIRSRRAAIKASNKTREKRRERAERRRIRALEREEARAGEDEDYYIDLEEDYGASPLERVTLERDITKKSDALEAKKKGKAKQPSKKAADHAPAATHPDPMRPLPDMSSLTIDDGGAVFAMPSFLRTKDAAPADVLPSSVPETEREPDALDMELGGAPLPEERAVFKQAEPETAPLPEKPKRRREKAKDTALTPEERAKDIKEVGEEIEIRTEKKTYQLPPIDLLTPGKPTKGDSRQQLMDTAAKLQQTLENFGVNVKVVNVSRGPTVTRYELQPEMGVKVSRIINLQDDIKLNLATSEIRIEAPIPGKAAVGIEVPNKEIAPVMLHDILDSDEFRNTKAHLPFAVGKDIGGRVVIADIEKMPHLLIAGATGSGKSVCINTLIMSILYKCTPDEVRLLMIDPKVVELKIYDGIPHLLIPVVTDARKAAGALNWAVQEMTDRYNKFAQYPGVRDIRSYNERVAKMNRELDEAEQIPTMPRIIVIVDELADLMMVASSEVEDAICRLAQLARAAGIHLIIATQRPSVNVVTGLIKANMPSRIALAVTSGIDSRTILDMNGAEKLLGKGDMLFYPQGYPKPARVQGGYVSDSDITDVVSFLTSQTDEVEYNKEVEEKISNSASPAASAGGASSDDGRDEYFEDSGRLIIEKDKASIGMLQRAFKIGFNRAARIMDQLADAGVVGGEEGTKPRKILMTLEEFEQLLQTE